MKTSSANLRGESKGKDNGFLGGASAHSLASLVDEEKMERLDEECEDRTECMVSFNYVNSP